MKALWRLTIFFGIFIVIFATFCLVINWQLTKIAELVENLHDHPMVVTKSSLSASRDMNKVGNLIHDLIEQSNPQSRIKKLAEMELIEKRVLENLNLVKKSIVGEDGRILLNRVFLELSKWRPIRDRTISMIQSGQSHKADLFFHDVGESMMERLEDSMTIVVNYADSQSMAFHAESIDDLQRAKIILFAAGIILVLLFSGGSIVIADSLFRPQQVMKKLLLEASDQLTREQADLQSISELVIRQGTQSKLIIKGIEPIADIMATFYKTTQTIKHDLNLVAQMVASEQLAQVQKTGSLPSPQLDALMTYLTHSITQLAAIAENSNSLAVSLKALDDIALKESELGDKLAKHLTNHATLIDEAILAVKRSQSALG